MEKANLPVEKAIEPNEEAHQPLVKCKIIYNSKNKHMSTYLPVFQMILFIVKLSTSILKCQLLMARVEV